MGQVVHFRGVESVVEAYSANGVGPWAILSGKTIVFSSEEIANDDVDAGAELLRRHLLLIKRGGTEGRYELRVYKLKDGEEIDSGTRYFRGFCFTLYENAYGGSNSDNRVIDMLTKMNERLEVLEMRPVELVEEEDKTVMGKLGAYALGLIETPMVQQMIVAGIGNVMGKFLPMNNSQGPAKVAGVQGADDFLSEGQKMKIATAVQRLAAKDPLLGDHLLKLADIAENNPAKYNAALNFL